MGGAVCNCSVDLAILDPTMRVQALGFVGDDESGDYILKELGRYPGIDLGMVAKRGQTSFTDVMTEEATGERTFFTYKGADSLLLPEDFDFARMRASILHIGYIMLLDGLDAEDSHYGTKMARVLHDARQAGLGTSIDVVSEAGDRFGRLVPPSLKYADYCTINETEASMITGVPLRDDQESLIHENLPKACEALKSMGVAKWATIHAPEMSAGIDTDGKYFALRSLCLPEGFIKGSVGAGDAFVSGVLLTAARGGSLGEAIELGTAVAACSLSEPGATEGVRDLSETMSFYRAQRKLEA
jgi:sugar/nucleoside kinase (ribokinase family)